MATFVETTALSLRKGSTLENEAFTGILGEVSVDYGFPDADGLYGTDINTTLRLHNGVVAGGIPLARADLCNVSTIALATNRHLYGDSNLAYADLRNIEQCTEPAAINKINQILHSYGIVNEDELSDTLFWYAKKDMSNVLTSTLADGRGRGVNGNLAYADTSNVNTQDLTNTSLHNGTNGNKPLSYADCSNTNTTNLTTSAHGSGPALARADMQNVTNETLDDIFHGTSRDFLLETEHNKDTVIGEHPELDHYPTSQAVKTYTEDYVAQEIAGANHVHTDLTNIANFDVLSGISENTIVYKEDPEHIVNVGAGYAVDTRYTTAKVLTEEDDIRTFNVTVKAVDTYGKPTAIEFTYPFVAQKYSSGSWTNTPIESPVVVTSANGTTMTVNFTSTQVNSDPSIYKYTITNFTVSNNNSGFEIKTYTTSTQIKTTLMIVPDEVNASGEIQGFYVYPFDLSTDYYGNTDVLGGTTPATIKLETVKAHTEDGLYGALAMTNLCNLEGMTDFDLEHEYDTKWRIRHDQKIPSIAISSLNASYYTDIATQGLVWDAIKNCGPELQGVVHVVGNEIINGIKTFNDGITTAEIRTTNADLAERYKSDKPYPTGTLVQFGGEKEITAATTEANAVISHAPAMVLNNDTDGQPIALSGKVPVRILGHVNKFDKIILSSDVPGVGIVRPDKSRKQVIAIALESNADEGEKLVRCVTKLTF